MAPIASRSDLVSWIESCILGDLRTLLAGTDTYYSSNSHTEANGRPLGAANFLLIAGCCSAIEYFGHILDSGANDEAKARAFIDRFLAPVDARYAEVDVLIWKCFRHGTVHRSWPKRITVEGEREVVVTSAGNEDQDPHLGPELERPGDSFVMNGRHLLRDLERALDRGFRDWILHQAPDSVLARANPQDLRISAGDVEGRAQVAAIRRWSRSCPRRPA
jgi:hypothetical protein